MSFTGIGPELLLLMFVSGLAISCVATFLGVGGGIMMVPLLIFLFPKFGVSPICAVHLAIGTSLLVIFIRSIPAAISYRHRGLIMERVVIPLALASVVGTIAGAALAAHLPGEILRRVFAFILFAAAARMAFSPPIRSDVTVPRTSWWMLLGVGVTAGFFSALLGIGGGLISVPLMAYLLKFPTKKLAATSTAIMIITSLAGMLQHAYHGYGSPELPAYAVGYVHWAAAIPLAVGGTISAPFGAYLNHKLDVDIFKKSFAAVLVIVGMRMLVF
jgi:uncharacterized membrane protein YfcA